MERHANQSGMSQPLVAPGPVRRSGPSIATVFGYAAYTFVLVAAIGLILAGAGVLGFSAQTEVRVAGYIGLFLFLTIAPVAWLLSSRQRLESESRLERHVEALADAVRLLRDQSALSDDARRVLNRRVERDLLCRAIEEDIQTENWDAAVVLCQELAERFGYRAEAEEFRARIEAARAEIQDRRVRDSIANLDGLIVQRRWDDAAQEAARVQRLFPDSPKVERLRERVAQARNVYKEDLERRFLDAANQSRIDEAMALLKELDLYLLESEAEQFREVARGVIGKARENLGAQFKIAVRDRRWSAAAALGRRIIAEFPNTRMAAEVRGMMDGILSKANAQPEPAEAR
jgi:hypothetical protein